MKFGICDLPIVLQKLFSKKFLGIDIGTSSIKIVEIEDNGHGFSLSNYGQIDIGSVESDAADLSKNAAAVFPADEVAQMIQAVLSDAKIRARQCAFSIPDFSTFFTTFTLPAMTEKELDGAVMFEARQHIPLPMDSVTVDWQLAAGEFGKNQKLEVTVAAVPNEIIVHYRQIASIGQLQVILMEAEMFGLARALISQDELRPVCMIDIGAQSTVCSLVEKRILRYSHSFDFGGNYLVNEFVRRLPVEPEMARDIGKSRGLQIFSLLEPEIKEKADHLLHEALLPVLREIEIMLGDYHRLTGLEAAKIILSGGAGAIPEVKKHFSDYFKKEVEIAYPFNEIGHSAEIEKCLKDIGPSYAVAVGMALRGFEFLTHNKSK